MGDKDGFGEKLGDQLVQGAMDPIIRWITLSIALGCIRLVYYLYKSSRESLTRTWPETKATIHIAETRMVGNQLSYRVLMEYSYYVEEYRAGRRSRLFGTESEAYAFAKNSTNSFAAVRYSRRNPDRSYLADDATDRCEKSSEQGPTFELIT